MDVSSAVVLAAGEGERLRPLTRYRPKPMLPAAGRPILEYILDALVEVGMTDINVVVGYRQERVRNQFGSYYDDVPLTYHTQEKQLGSGHALLQAEESVDADCVVVNGDEVVAASMVEQVIAAHTVEDIATLAVVESEEAPMYGAVELDGDEVVRLKEKPDDDTYRLMNAGIYAVGPSFFDHIAQTDRTDGEIILTETLSKLVDEGERVRGVRTEGFRTEVTYPWDLPGTTADLLTAEGADLPVSGTESRVADSATVHDDAVLNEPVVVGPDAVVEATAVVGPYVALGRNTTVGAGAVVERSVVDDDTRVGPNVTLVDSVAGQGVTFEAGVTAPRGPSDVHVGDRIHEDRPLGCVVADRTTVGGGATIEPGSLVGPDATVGPGTHVAGDVAAEAEVRR